MSGGQKERIGRKAPVQDRCDPRNQKLTTPRNSRVDPPGILIGRSAKCRVARGSSGKEPNYWKAPIERILHKYRHHIYYRRTYRKRIEEGLVCGQTQVRHLEKHGQREFHPHSPAVPSPCSTGREQTDWRSTDRDEPSSSLSPCRLTGQINSLPRFRNGEGRIGPEG